jgi:triacylglycerol lipase
MPLRHAITSRLLHFCREHDATIERYCVSNEKNGQSFFIVRKFRDSEEMRIAGEGIMKGISFALSLIGIVMLCGHANADISRLPPEVVAGIAALGPVLDPPMIAKTRALMNPLAPMTPPDSVTIAKDVAYGDDPLQRFDIYSPPKTRGLPIVVFVHGGGFVGGDKGDYNNVPTYLSQHGMVAVNADYRLAPKVTWPAGSEDVGAMVAFLKKNGAHYGGDPRRIVLIGHSAGANLVASYVLDPAIHPKSGPGVVAAVLVSLPASRVASIGERDKIYYGDDAGLYAKRAPATHVDESKLPLLVVTAEFDPVSLAPDAYDLAAKVCMRDGKCPAFFYVKGHNHISEIGSIGTKDDQLARALVDFIRHAR